MKKRKIIYIVIVIIFVLIIINVFLNIYSREISYYFGYKFHVIQGCDIIKLNTLYNDRHKINITEEQSNSIIIKHGQFIFLKKVSLKDYCKKFSDFNECINMVYMRLQVGCGFAAYG